jgi:prepilin-type N-terminal cleavage/methylation domain-containing protein
MKNTHQKGFTLVELAIVLVIIGLIVSSVLVGQDLIKAAELRATVKQYNDFQAAVNTFIGKYNKLPGDIDGDKYGLSGGCNGAAATGDEDGVLEGESSTLNNRERVCFWANLTTAGKELIPGVYDGHESDTNSATINDVVGENIPKMKMSAYGWGVYTANSNHYFFTGVIGGQADDNYETAEPFAPIDAFNIDSKIDDGAPMSGSVVAVDGQTSGAPNETNNEPFVKNSGAGTADSCAVGNTTPTEYQFSRNEKNCNLRFDMDTF